VAAELNVKRKEIQPAQPQMKKKIIITQLLYNIKKFHQFIFSLPYEKN